MNKNPNEKRSMIGMTMGSGPQMKRSMIGGGQMGIGQNRQMIGGPNQPRSLINQPV